MRRKMFAVAAAAVLALVVLALPAGAASGNNPKAALHELPPLIKGYLRLGAYIGDGAVIDHQFGTTDVLIVMPVSAIHARYIEHFGADASRHAA